MTTTDLLSGSELFRNLDPWHLDRLADMSTEFSWQTGTAVFNEGDEAAFLYVLADGRIALEIDILAALDRPARPTTVDVVGPGDCFGWSALVAPHAYTATARCLSTSQAIGIEASALRRYLGDSPVIGREVMGSLAQIVSQRLAQTRMRLTTQITRLLDRTEW